MQVFLSEYSFAKSAEVLDTKRLVKQLLEGRQILQTLVGESQGWRNHPAVKMFDGSEGVLVMYLSAIRDEMEKRGYKWQNNWEVITRITDTYLSKDSWRWNTPKWMQHNEFKNVVITHRGRLFEKAPHLYPQYESENKIYRDYVCCERCNYYWTTHKN